MFSKLLRPSEHLCCLSTHFLQSMKEEKFTVNHWGNHGKFHSSWPSCTGLKDPGLRFSPFSTGHPNKKLEEVTTGSNNSKLYTGAMSRREPPVLENLNQDQPAFKGGTTVSYRNSLYIHQAHRFMKGLQRSATCFHGYHFSCSLCRGHSE